MRDVAIKAPSVELYKVLKFDGLVGSGGAAKMAVANGEVTVNGAVELRKRRKIVEGDIIAFEEQSIRIFLSDDV